MADSRSPVFSSGDIAREEDVPQHRVDYVIRTRRIKPVQKAGGRNLYSEAAANRIASELRRIDAEKEVLE